MGKIGVIGSGTWGTAIAVLLNNNGHQVDLWSAIPQEIEEMRSTHKHKNLPEVTLPDSIRYTADLEEAMKEKDMLVLSVPSVFVRSTARRMKEFCLQGQIIVDVAKGIEEDTLKTMTEIIQEEIPQCEPAVLSGPSHAEEVSRGLPTTCVAGSRKKRIAGGRPVRLYEPCIPGVHKPGRPWHRGGGCLKECGGPGGGSGRRSGVRR